MFGSRPADQQRVVGEREDDSNAPARGFSKVAFDYDVTRCGV